MSFPHSPPEIWPLLQPPRAGSPPAGRAALIPHEDRLTAAEATSSLAGAIMGTGLLFLPCGFHLSSGPAIGLMLALVVIMGFTGLLVGHCLDLAEGSALAKQVPRKRRGFGFLAEVALGRGGRVLIDATVAAEVWFMLVSLTVVTAENLSYLFGVGTNLSVVLVCGMGALTNFIPLRASAYVSGLSTAALCVFLLAFCLNALSWAPFQDWPAPPEKPDVAQPANLARTIGMILFALDVHPCLPMVHQCMVEKQRWGECVCVSFSVALAALGGYGFLASGLYGDNLLASVLGNFEHPWLKKIVAGIIIFKIKSIMPLFLDTLLVALRCPPAGTFEEELRGAGAEASREQTSSGAAGTSLHMVGLVAVSCATGASAILFVARLDAIFSIGGCVLITVHAIIFPAATYLRLRALARRGVLATEKLPHPAAVGMSFPCLLVLAAAAVVAGCGTTAHIVELSSGHKHR